MGLKDLMLGPDFSGKLIQRANLAPDVVHGLPCMVEAEEELHSRLAL